jgi:hypothetical protein
LDKNDIQKVMQIGVAYAWQAAVIGGGILAAKIIHGAAIMIMRIA